MQSIDRYGVVVRDRSEVWVARELVLRDGVLTWCFKRLESS